MRILINYPYFPHYREAVIRRIASHRDLSIILVSDTKTNAPALRLLNLERIIKDTSLSSRQVFVSVKNRWFLGRFLWQSGLLGCLLRRRPDVVIMLGAVDYISCWVVSFYCRVAGIPCVMWTHGLYGREGWFLSRIRVLFYNLANHIMTYGDRAKVMLQELGVSGDKITVIHNSLDLDEQRRCLDRIRVFDRGVVKQQLGIDRDRSVVVFVGRITRVKRIDVLLAAFAQVVKSCGENDRPLLLIVGEGPERERLDRLVRELGIGDDVVFRGAVYDEEELAAIFYVSDVCASPGDVGLLAMHAMAYGVPVVTHGNFERQMPEVEAIVEGETGSFFRESDETSLAVEINRWLRLSEDERVNVRRRCIQVVEAEWSPEFQVEKILSVCEKLTTRGK